eukprot:4873168-Amphidinium_carterae.1
MYGHHPSKLEKKTTQIDEMRGAGVSLSVDCKEMDKMAVMPRKDYSPNRNYYITVLIFPEVPLRQK